MWEQLDWREIQKENCRCRLKEKWDKLSPNVAMMSSFSSASQQHCIHPLQLDDQQGTSYSGTSALCTGFALSFPAGKAQPDTSQQFRRNPKGCPDTAPLERVATGRVQWEVGSQGGGFSRHAVVSAFLSLKQHHSSLQLCASSRSACRPLIFVPLPRSYSNRGSVCLQLLPSPWDGELASVTKQVSAAGSCKTCGCWNIPLETSRPCLCVPCPSFHITSMGKIAHSSRVAFADPTFHCFVSSFAFPAAIPHSLSYCLLFPSWTMLWL